METITLEWYDYSIVIIILISSTLTGVYYGCFGNQKKSKENSLQKSKTINPFSVATSIVACTHSGKLILGLTADVYLYGAMIFWIFLPLIAIALLSIYIYLPVFHTLQISTIYEYLEKRFDRKVRQIMCVSFILSNLLFLCLVIYAPALTFAAESGLKVTVVAVIISGICTFYTSIGGLKTVIVTDTFQFLVIFAALVLVLVLGVASIGVSEIWHKNLQSGRLNIFDFDPDPTKRESVWIIVLGMTFYTASYTSVDQIAVQKFLSLSSFQNVITCAVYYSVGSFLVKFLCISLGLTIYAKYSSCDLFLSGRIERNDQVLAYFVIEITQNVPGLSGLFVAVMLSSALSVQSSVLNCLAYTIYADFIRSYVNSERKAGLIEKLLVVAVGALCTLVVMFLKNLSGIFVLFVTTLGIIAGPIVGVFTMGVLWPKANSHGAFYSYLLTFLAITLLAIPAKYYEAQGLINYPTKPISVDNCTAPANTTNLNYKNNTNSNFGELPSSIFKITFYYYSLIGFIICFASGVIISWLFPDKKLSELDKKLFNPLCHRFLAPPENKNEDSESLRLDLLEK